MSLSKFEKEICENIVNICKNPKSYFENNEGTPCLPNTESDIQSALNECFLEDYGVNTEKAWTVDEGAFLTSDVQFEKINTSIEEALKNATEGSCTLHLDLTFSPNDKEGEELEKVVEVKFPKNFWFEAEEWTEKAPKNIKCDIASNIYSRLKNKYFANQGTDNFPYPSYCNKNGSWKGKKEINQYKIENKAYVFGQHIELMFVDFARLLQYAKQNKQEVELYFVAFFTSSDSQDLNSNMRKIIAKYQEEKPTAFLTSSARGREIMKVKPDRYACEEHNDEECQYSSQRARTDIWPHPDPDHTMAFFMNDNGDTKLIEDEFKILYEAKGKKQMSAFLTKITPSNSCRKSI